MLRSLVGVLLLFIAVASARPASASSILINGSFELGPPPFSVHDIDIPPGSTDISGWLVTGSGVDLLEDPWDVSDGLRAIDLDGRSPGGIQQTFATTPGQMYSVAFDLSGNPEGGSAIKSMRVAVDGFTHDYTFDTTGLAIDALMWQSVMFSFLATDLNSTLSFMSLSATGNAYGALIDNVSAVQAVPEPMSVVLVGTGLFGTLVRRRLRVRR